jgi:drug/metabolite transporter (DMT)-like permease
VILNFFLSYRGELAAGLAAGIWAGSAMFYGQIGRQISPLVLNLSKGLLAIGYLAITMALTGDSFQLPMKALGLLLLSGLVGIALGDTVFFGALNRVGARLTLLINTLSPVATALLANVFLGEKLRPWSYLGICLAIGGIAGVISDQTVDRFSSRDAALVGRSRQYWLGIGFGVISALANSAASVLSRQAMSAQDLSPVATTFWRLVAGTIGILVLLAGQKKRPSLKLSSQTWSQLGAVAFFSTYLGISLQQTALKFTAAGIAQTIGATSPLFVLGIDCWRGEKIGWRSVGYGILSIGGVSLLFV